MKYYTTKDIQILNLNVDSAVKAARLKIIPDNAEDFVKKTFVLPAKDEKTGIRNALGARGNRAEYV